MQAMPKWRILLFLKTIPHYGRLCHNFSLINIFPYCALKKGYTLLFLLSFLGLCTSTCTSLAFWLQSPCIRNTNPGTPHPPLKRFPLPPPPSRPQPSISPFTPTTMTKQTENPLLMFFSQALCAQCSLNTPGAQGNVDLQVANAAHLTSVTIPKGHSFNLKW